MTGSVKKEQVFRELDEPLDFVDTPTEHTVLLKHSSMAWERDEIFGESFGDIMFHPGTEPELDLGLVPSLSFSIPDGWTQVMAQMEATLRTAIDRMFIHTTMKSLSRRIDEVQRLSDRVERLEKILGSVALHDVSIKEFLPKVNLDWEGILTSASNIAEEFGWSLGFKTDPSNETLLVKVPNDIMDEVMERNLEFSARLIEAIGLESGRRLSLEIQPATDQN